MEDGGSEMKKKLLLSTILLALGIAVPVSAMAAVDISIGISLPPPIVFQAPPEVIVMPDTDDVYVVPTVDVDLFFWNGWWWRRWEGRWYRSQYYDRDWGYYDSVPIFYFDVDPVWRGYVGAHNWYVHRWDYQPIPLQRLLQSWQGWHNDRHWERQGTWGVQNYQARPQPQREALRQQRQQQYEQSPEVQQARQQRQERSPLSQGSPQVQQPSPQPPERGQQSTQGSPPVQQARPQPQGRGEQPERTPQVQQPRPQPQARGEQPQRQEQGPQAEPPEHSQPQGRPEGGEGERRK
jgi:hypothetical protein